MARTPQPLTGRQPPRAPSAGLRSDPPGPCQRPVPPPGQARQAAAGPIVVLTYSFSGSRRLQDVLERDPELACTAGTGILGLCDVAARAWASVEESNGEHLSSLAATSIRATLVPMMTVIMARSSRARRWCETATANPAAAETFLRIVPGTQFLCLHRSCPDLVRAVLASSPWGILSGPFTPYLQAYPANTAAAIAACWADSAGQLLDFETRHPGSALRVRYEDLASDPAATSRAISAFTGITPASPVPELAQDELPGGGTTGGSPAGPDAGFPAGPETRFPAAMLPTQLIQRINHLHDQLNYPHVSDSAPTSRELTAPAAGPTGPGPSGRPGNSER
jgi:Sulfotransferase family